MAKKKFKIGIPRALLYYRYWFFWKKFFEELNCEVITSPETNSEILDRGVNLAVDESCLSIKIFLGHVDWLKDKVDYVFIPHIVSPKRGEQTCVKMVALYDIVKNTFDDLNLLEYTLDADNFCFDFFAYFKAGLRITKNPFSIIKAYIKAKKYQEKNRKENIENQLEKIKNKKEDDLLVLITSHPYTTYDSFLGKPIIDFLKSQGVSLIFSDNIPEEAKSLYKEISSDLYWGYSKDLLGAVEYYKEIVDGVIFLMTFPCGPDSLVINLCQSKIKIPTTLLVLDELQGEAGLKTRLESFIDILRMKNDKKGIFN